MDTFLISTNGLIAIILLFIIVLAMLIVVIKQGVSIRSKKGSVHLGRSSDGERFMKLCADVEALTRNVEALARKNDELSLGVMRLEIMSDALPPMEKLNQYDKYKELGGNSYIDVIIKRYKDEAEI